MTRPEHPELAQSEGWRAWWAAAAALALGYAIYVGRGGPGPIPFVFLAIAIGAVAITLFEAFTLFLIVGFLFTR